MNRSAPHRARLASRGLFAAAIALAVITRSASAAEAPPVDPASPHASIKIDIAGYDETVGVYRTPEGGHLYRLRHDDAPRESWLSPQQFSELLVAEGANRSWWFAFLNITTPLGLAWVAIGLVGQVLFTGRMVVQWLASEKERRSVVPPVFWWMSLIGATMLLVYFIWRKDVIGVLGQAVGWGIYVRNLYFVYTHSPTDTADADPTHEADTGA